MGKYNSLNERSRERKGCIGMKYVVVLADGMADYPIKLGSLTPLQVAETPTIDF